VVNETLNYEGCCEVKKSCEGVDEKAACHEYEITKDDDCLWVEDEVSGQECQKVYTTCDEVTQGPITCESSGIAATRSGSSWVDVQDCFWLYNNSDSSVNTGTCRSKTDSSLECLKVYRSSQCTQNDVDKFNTNCYWIYNESSGEGGTCYSKENTSLTCGDIKRSEQCTDGVGIINLADKCALYSGICKTKCSLLGTGQECTSGDRGNDCFLLENADESANSCRNRVCLCLYVFEVVFICIVIRLYVHYF
jgi:hypothetical protein